MGSDSSKIQNKSNQNTPELSLKGLPIKRRTSSGTPTYQATPPTIKVGASVSCNEGFIMKENKKQSPDRLEVSRSRSGSSCSDRERYGSVRHKNSSSQHPITTRNRQLIQSCFQNPHEVIGRKIAKRTAEKRNEFAKFYMALTKEQSDDFEEQIKVLLKKSVANIDFLDEVQRLAEEFGEKYVQYRSIGFKADFFAAIADATITECAFLDNAVHPAHQTLSAFSQFITMVFSSVRDGFYQEMRRLRRTSNSFSTGSNSSCRRKKLGSNASEITNYDGFPQISHRSASPGADSRLSDDCFAPSYGEDDGFLKPPTASSMLTARSAC